MKKNRKNNENLEECSKEELIQKVKQLEAHVFQLRNVISKLSGEEKPKPKVYGKRDKPFDFTLYKKRHVLFHIAYWGWDYHGFATQEDNGKTIESELFRALTKTCLIESRETSNYHRCGRTDKGVSAFSQAISIDVRTNLLEGKGVFTFDECKAQDRKGEKDREMDYCKMLNSTLPSNIQVVAWAPLENRDFSARFDCKSRTYKYFFPRANMCLNKINEAGQKLLGEHDFRNFCKMDVNNGVVNYHRNVMHFKAEVVQSQKESEESPYDMCSLTIQGKAFLWHQIRCIVTILFLIGEGKEDSKVVDELLDIEKNPCRPQYQMASEIPLVLFDCQFDGIEWNYDLDSLQYVITQFQELMTENSVKAAMLHTALKVLESKEIIKGQPVSDQARGLSAKTKAKNYVPLMQLLKCPSLEEKIEHYSKKRKIDNSEQE